MKRFTFLAVFFAMVLGMNAQYYMHVWYNDSVFSLPVQKVDSITFTDTWLEPGEPVDPEPEPDPIEPYKSIGIFTVGEGKSISFAPGNLQYTQSTNTWAFAENQWDMIGTDNVTGGSVSSDPNYGDEKDGTALADKIDLFGWSTSATNFGVSTSTDWENSYLGSFVDWGTNKIGSDAPNTWRTLTCEEWNYLLYYRTNASSLRGVAQVNGVNGLIFLPDNWTCPAGVTFKSGFHSNYSTVDNYAAYQTFTADQWSKLEKSGAVFLPAAGYRNGSNVSNVQYSSAYWSATEDYFTGAYGLTFFSGGASMTKYHRHLGQSVRLVKDIEDEPVEPEPEPDPIEPYKSIGIFTVGEGKAISFAPGNLQYHPANNEWRFAANQTDYIGSANANISSTTYNGWLDLFGWSTSATYFGVSTSTSSNYYSGSFVDWGTNRIGNDAPNTWRTLTYDEWNYLLYYRNNASSLRGVAQVNGVNGLIFLPDTWTCPAGVTFKSGFHSDWSVEAYGQYQTFTAEQWSKLESAGAVFLPAAGNRYGFSVYVVQYDGFYWSATEYDDYNADYLDFYSDGADVYYSYRYTGKSVRLVKDVEDEPVDPEPEPETPSGDIGVFSVSATKQVTFSPGNLQYHPANNEWRFAENQTDYIGEANSNCSSTYNGWLDMFGWSTSANYFGVSTSTSYSDYSGSFIDWGTNKIGNDAPNTWRTLSFNEWKYLLSSRPNASSLKGVAEVNYVNGLILLPDNWVCPSDITFKSGFHSNSGVDYYAAYQTFTADQWSKLEAAGAVFLPAAGYRSGSIVYNVQDGGYYWSAIEVNSEFAGGLGLYSDEAYVYGYVRERGLSVRLVKDVEDEPVEPEQPGEPVDPEPAKNITVKALVPAAWTNTITAWVWPTGGEGKEVVPTKEGDWYVYTENCAELNIIFKNGAGWTGDQNQTVDMTFSESTCIAITTGSGKATYTVVDCEGGVTPDPEPEAPSEGIGVFSVSADKKVTFSKGNLQYTQSTNTWSFAENQWDMIGTDNVISSDQYDDCKYGDALADKIDLFGWSTSTNDFGVSTSTNDADYDGDFVDWGTNPIGDDAPDTWRSLTYGEWNYLIQGRDNYSSLYGIAQVNGVNGLILLPDNWTCPDGITFKSGFSSEWGYAAYQTFTAEQWTKLEIAGAVFLPASGARYGSDVCGTRNYGQYWSSSNYLGYVYISTFSPAPSVYYDLRYYGRSVRLVKDLQ